jgi:hypothetical protein
VADSGRFHTDAAAGLVVISTAELARVVHAAVVEALEAAGAGGGSPALMRRDDAAAYLNVSPRTLDTLRETAGLPTRWVGDSPRFDRSELNAWSRAQAGYTSRRAQAANGGKHAESAATASAKGTAEKAHGKKRNDSAKGVG